MSRSEPIVVPRWPVICLLTLAWSTWGCERFDATPQLRLFDLSGKSVDPLKGDEAKAKVFLFTRADCPISNRYAPEIQRMHEEFSGQGVEFFLVYPDPDQTAEGIRKHMREYDYKCQALRDPNHALVEYTGAEFTPEAAVLLPSGEMVYRGRIDDRYVDFGKARAQASKHDLQDALEAVLAGQPVTHRTTKAIGCYISDLK